MDLKATPIGKPQTVEEFLHELDGWERAYPLSAFPEPDFVKAAALLKAGGMTLDAISASNMRHVVSQIAPKARAALALVSGEATPGSDGDDVIDFGGLGGAIDYYAGEGSLPGAPSRSRK